MRITTWKLIPVLLMAALAFGNPTPADNEKAELESLADASGYTTKDIELMKRALEQTPMEDRHLILKKVIRLGILSAILATPAVAASLIPLALVPLILMSKHRVPPINVIPLPPPQENYYQPQSSYSAPPSYSAPASPPDYSAPASPPASYAPASPPASYAPASPPAYSPPQSSPPAYGASNDAPQYAPMSPPQSPPSSGYRR